MLHLCYFLTGHGGTEKHSKFLRVCVFQCDLCPRAVSFYLWNNIRDKCCSSSHALVQEFIHALSHSLSLTLSHIHTHSQTHKWFICMKGFCIAILAGILHVKLIFKVCMVCFYVCVCVCVWSRLLVIRH